MVEDLIDKEFQGPESYLSKSPSDIFDLHLKNGGTQDLLSNMVENGLDNY